MSEFGIYKDTIEFSEKSNSILKKVADSSKFIEKIMSNNLLIADALLNLGEYKKSLVNSDDLYNSVTKPSVWNENLGKFVVASVKLTFQVIVRDASRRIQNTLFYIFTMLDRTEEPLLSSEEQAQVETLKLKCEVNKGPSGLINALFSDINKKSSIYSVDNLVNTSYRNMLEIYDSQVKDSLETLHILYHCLGMKVIDKLINPIT